jgi:hypothetical protein
MGARGLLVVLGLVAACGDDGGSKEPKFEPRAPAEQPCRTLTLGNATAFEKVNAALCFGIGLPNPQTIACQFSVGINETRCTGDGFDYIVQWNGNVDGDVFGTVSKEFLGSITQGPQGAFELMDAQGLRASCTVVGDVANFCLQN